MRKSVRTTGHVSASAKLTGLALVNPYLEEQDIREALAFAPRPARIPYPNGVQSNPPRRSIHVGERIEQSRHHPERLRKAKTADRSEPITQVPPK
jgi:hypothetical protein